MLFPYWLPVLLYMIWSLITIYVLSIVWVLWERYIPQFHGNYSETVLLSVDKHAIFRTCFICNSTSLSYELIWHLCLWVCANTLPCFILLKPMKDISNFSEFIKRFKFQPILTDTYMSFLTSDLNSDPWKLRTGSLFCLTVI